MPAVSLNRFVEATEFHQRHAERVPAVEKIGRDLDTAPVFCYRALEVTDGDVATRIIKNLLKRLSH